MSVLILPSKRIIQPQQHCGVAPEVLGFSPKLATSFVSPENIVTGRLPATINSKFKPNIGGLGLQGDGTSGGGLCSHAIELRGTKLFLVVSIIPAPYAGTFGVVCETTSNANLNLPLSPFWLISYLDELGAAATPTKWALMVYGAGPTYASVSFPAPTADTVANITAEIDLTYNGSAVRNIFVNGVNQPLTIGLTSLTPGSTFATNDIYIGSRGNASLFGAHGINALAVFNDAPKLEIQRSISSNPWQIFAPHKRRLWSVAAGGGATGTGTAVTTGTAIGASLFNASVNGTAVTTAAGIGASLFNAAVTGAAIATSAASGVGLFQSEASGNAVTSGLAVGESVSVGQGVATGTAIATGAAIGASLFNASVNGTAVTTGTAIGVGSSLAESIASGSCVATGTVISSFAPVTQIGGGAGAPHGIYYQDQKKRKITRKPLDKLMDDAVAEYYKEIIAEAPRAVQHKAAKIVKPYAEDKKKIPAKVDWKDFSLDIAKVKELLALYNQEIVEKAWIDQDDEEVLLLAYEHDKNAITQYFQRFYN